MAVLSALAEAALFIKDQGLTSADARQWLDAAVRLRTRGEKVTAALLAATMAEPPTLTDAQRTPEEGPQKKRSDTTLER